MSTTHDGYLTGKLLIATPAMGDPRFERSVIFMASHDAEQAMGFILNKPKPRLPLSKLLEQLDINGSENAGKAKVLNGGPVETERGFVIHTDDYFDDAGSLKVTDTVSVTTTKGALTALVSASPPRKARLALGYAGWSAGQLEGELKQNAWLVADASEDIIFDGAYRDKWTAALSSIGIKPEMLSALSGRA